MTDGAVYSIPLRTRFRGLSHREGIVLRGPMGWGEFSPFLEYDAQVSASWLASAREAAFEGWPSPVRHQIPINVTVPACSPQQAKDIMANRQGARTAKVKVAEKGQRLSDDIARLEAVRDGFDGQIRIDVNGGWSVDEAVSAIRVLERSAGGLEYVEQPCATVEELAALRRRIGVAIAADESIRRAEDPYRVRDLEAADIAVLKVQPLGGVRRCLQIADDIGLPVVVSSAVETSIGIAAGIALAAALPDLPYACGLATMQLLEGDLSTESMLPVAGTIDVRRPEVDVELLARWAHPDPDSWWQRLAEVDALGQDQPS